MEGLTHTNYGFLAELGIDADNMGCYTNGKWVGSGNSTTSINPHNNKQIANVRLASVEDYH